MIFGVNHHAEKADLVIIEHGSVRGDGAEGGLPRIIANRA
jgi:hypothetical protein